MNIPNDMGCVPGGIFILGSSATDWKSESYDLSSFAEHTVELSTFLIDKKEVTTQDYQACVKTGQCEPQSSNYPHLREPNQPQLKVNWYQAKTYCEAKAKRLPTEAEFEAASRGPNGEMYPWGNEIANCNLAIIKDETGRGCQGHKSLGWHETPTAFKETGATWDVASKKPYRYGLYDMAGNAQEWVSDWFAPTLESCGQSCLGKDPKGPCNGANHCQGFTEKLVKGGSWYWGAIAARSAARRPHFPQNSPIHHFGFRCAKSIM
ncbi:MAG: SUMF1/EgtB/PvdO family nonheme iron enzyme [Leptonema sp. (in: Bacteria)]|nr:SUMF1/EgtB/PvdO family nonheme iron enzyme [Leptonema sp. (in: bacteria)]